MSVLGEVGVPKSCLNRAPQDHNQAQVMNNPKLNHKPKFQSRDHSDRPANDASVSGCRRSRHVYFGDTQRATPGFHSLRFQAWALRTSTVLPVYLAIYRKVILKRRRACCSGLRDVQFLYFKVEVRAGLSAVVRETNRTAPCLDVVQSVDAEDHNTSIVCF